VAWAWRSQCGDGRSSRDAACSGGVHQAPHLGGGEKATSGTRGEDRRVRWCTVADRHQLAPHGGGQEDDARLATLTVGGHLAGVAAFAQVAPGQAGDLVDAQACCVQQPQQHVVSPRACFLNRRAAAGWWLLRGDKQPVNVAFGQDALGERVLQLGPLDDSADVEGQVAEAVAKAEQRFDRRDFSRTRTGGEVFFQSVHPGLDVADSHRVQRLSHEPEETVDVGAVGALGVRAAAVQPELPLRTTNVPKMLRKNATMMRTMFQALSIPRRSCIWMLWMNAVPTSQGMIAMFSTGSQPQ
jgi:hypothetical protein